MSAAATTTLGLAIVSHFIHPLFGLATSYNPQNGSLDGSTEPQEGVMLKSAQLLKIDLEKSVASCWENSASNFMLLSFKL